MCCGIFVLDIGKRVCRIWVVEAFGGICVFGFLLCALLSSLFSFYSLSSFWRSFCLAGLVLYGVHLGNGGENHLLLCFPDCLCRIFSLLLSTVAVQPQSGDAGWGFLFSFFFYYLLFTLPKI